MQPGAPPPPPYPYPYPYPPQPPRRSAGVTVAIVLGCVFGGIFVLGILAAVAIPQFLKYEKRSKSGESERSLDLIKRAEKAQFAENGGFVVGTAGPTPADPCCDSVDHKCAPDPADFEADPIWSQLDFRIDTPFYCQYTYEGTKDHFTADAICDLDCDGTPADYELDGSVDASGAPRFVVIPPPPSVH